MRYFDNIEFIWYSSWKGRRFELQGGGQYIWLVIQISRIGISIRFKEKKNKK